MVFGVPHSFSSLTAVWCLGYSQISWHSPSGFEPTTVPVDKKICTALPGAEWVGANQDNKYKESHKSFPITDAVKCAPGFTPCQQDTTLLGFQVRAAVERGARLDARSLAERRPARL